MLLLSSRWRAAAEIFLIRQRTRRTFDNMIGQPTTDRRGLPPTLAQVDGIAVAQQKLALDRGQSFLDRISEHTSTPRAGQTLLIRLAEGRSLGTCWLGRAFCVS